MDIAAPHYLLFSHTDRIHGRGEWEFILRARDGTQRFEAKDAEPDLSSERLDLLTVVRALESLDQPSRVTLIESSDYVWKGVRYGLPEWRTNGWRWEFFGQMVPVKNSDLWQRLDRAMRFHEVECQRRRFDSASRPQEGVKRPHWTGKHARGLRERLSDWLKYAVGLTRRNMCVRALRWKVSTD